LTAQKLQIECYWQVKFVLESRKFVLASQDVQQQDVDDLISCISETLITVFPAISGYMYLTSNIDMQEMR